MKRFRKIYVEITNICNMHCSFCPETKRAKATMSVKDFEYVAKQIIEYTDYIYLHVKGEPLLHPGLKEILDICKEYNLKVNISTNGTLLNKNKELLKGIRQLNVSLHSFEQDNNIKLEEYLRDVLSACNELSNSGVIIRYKLWNAEKDILNNEKIIRALAEMYNVELNDTTYSKDKKLSENIYLSIKTPFKWPDLKDAEQQESTCHGLRGQIAILVDGTVVPCCVDNNGDIPLGNIFKTELAQILNSKRAIDIKKGFENNKCTETLCKKCEYRKFV